MNQFLTRQQADVLAREIKQELPEGWEFFGLDEAWPPPYWRIELQQVGTRIVYLFHNRQEWERFRDNVMHPPAAEQPKEASDGN